jgi:hypothetical protein
VGAPLTAAACEVLTSGPSWVPTSLPAYPAASIYDPDLVVENNWGTGEQTLQVYNAELETTAVSYQGGVLSATICNRFPSATWWGGEIYESQDDVFDPLDGTFRDPITAYISASIPIPAFSCLNISEPYAVSQPWAMSRSVLNSE